MKDLSYIGMIILYVGIALNILFSNRADKTLSPEQKLHIEGLRSKMNIYHYLWLAAIALFFTVKLFISSLDEFYILVLAIAILPFEISLKFVFVKKLKRLDITKLYIRNDIFAEMILLAAFVFWIGIELVK